MDHSWRNREVKPVMTTTLRVILYICSSTRGVVSIVSTSPERGYWALRGCQYWPEDIFFEAHVSTDETNLSIFVMGSQGLPRPPKGSKKWNPLI